MGYYNRKQLAPDVVNSLKRMLSVLRHRGPDGNGLYRDNKTLLGHTRLKVIDMAGGIQPMTNEDGSLWITFNGEIFNYPELRKELISRGHKFKTNSDTEVILHLYEEKKEKCVHYFNGQFAFAIRDNINDELFLARDHAGILPLFYTITSRGDFCFASEIKALFCDQSVEREADNSALNQIFTFWTTLPGRTFFKNINELPPAHYIIIKNREFYIRRYWEHDYINDLKPENINIPNIVEEAESLLIDSVRLRLRADVPVGSYLSGGIDSSGITSIIRNNFNNDLKTFGLLFEEEDFNEFKYQQSATSFLKTSHSTKLVTNEDIAANFTRMLYYGEKPVLRTASVPLLLLSEEVKSEGYKVVLSGEGADEIFGGYNIFKETYIRQFWSRRPLSEKRPLLLKNIYPYIFKDDRAYHSLKEFFKYGISNPDNLFFSHEIRWKNSARIKNFFSDDLKHSLQNCDALDELGQHLPENFKNWDYFARAQYLEFILFLSGYLLTSQGDRAAMGNSVELRVPYLDVRLIEYMSGVPLCLKLRGLNEKYLLKKIFKGKLPSDILQRPKHPFRAPIKNIFKHHNELLEEFCSTEKIIDAGLFDPSRTRMLFNKTGREGSFSETDNMALAGILSAQTIYFMFIKNFNPVIEELKIDHYFDCRSKREEPHEILV